MTIDRECLEQAVRNVIRNMAPFYSLKWCAGYLKNNGAISAPFVRHVRDEYRRIAPQHEMYGSLMK